MISNQEVEEAMIGTILTQSDIYYDIAGEINEACFYNPAYKFIYQCIKLTAGLNLTIDLVTVADTIAKNMKDMPDVLKQADINPIPLLSGSMNKVTFNSNVKDYVKILNDYRRSRETDEMGKEIREMTKKRTPVTEILAYVNTRIMEISDIANKQDVSMNDCLYMFAQMLDTPIGDRMILSRIPELDHQIGGFERSDLVILAGASSMGKTSMCLKLAKNFVLDEKSVAIFSLEMNLDQLMTRIISEETSIPIRNIRYKNFQNGELERIQDSYTRFENKKMVVDSNSVKLHDILSKIKKYKIRDNIDVVIIDYLQLVDNKGGSKGQSREQEVSTVVRSLKNIAKELGIVVIALSQLNRSLAQRDNKRPILSDLRESGEIEQAADIIMFVYRDDYYNLENRDNEIQDVELMIAKGRNVGVGTVNLKFRPAITKFLSNSEH